jgi:hypothetical protein
VLRSDLRVWCWSAVFLFCIVGGFVKGELGNVDSIGVSYTLSTRNSLLFLVLVMRQLDS